MPAPVITGDPADFKPNVDIGFRFDDAAFLPLSEDDKNRLVDEAAVRLAQYLKYQDPEDEGEPDAPTIFLPDMKELAITVSTLYNRDWGAPEDYFMMEVRFIDDPSQTTGIPPARVRAQAVKFGEMFVAEIAAIESAESLPITATINWL